MKKKLWRVLPWMMVAAAYLLTVTFFALYGSHNLNGDDASELVHAALLNSEGKWMLTENWLYSTELRIVSPTALYQLGLRLMPTWHGAQVFAQAVGLALVLASFVYMAREMGMKTSTPYLATVLMLPFCDVYDYMIAYGVYYSVHLMLSFVLLALVARVGNRKKRGCWIALCAIAAIGLWSGLGGVRMLLMIVAPLFCAAAVMALLEMKRHETFRAALKTPALRMAGASALCLAATGAGYAASLALFEGKYAYMSYTDIRMSRFKITDLLNQISAVIDDLGYSGSAMLMSPKGINNLICVTIFIAICVAVWRMMSRYEHLSAQHRLLTLTAVMAVLIGMLSNILLNQLLTRYFTVGIVLLFVVLALAIEVEPCKNAALRTLALLALTACCAFGASCIMRYGYWMGDVNYEMAAKWLVERGYTQGYATHWNANLFAYASDGQLDMWVLSDSSHSAHAGKWRTMGMQQMLQDKRKLTQDPEGKVFLLVTEAELKEDSPLLHPDHFVDEIAWSYYIYEYDSAAQMRALIAQAEEAQQNP